MASGKLCSNISVNSTHAFYANPAGHTLSSPSNQNSGRLIAMRSKSFNEMLRVGPSMSTCATGYYSDHRGTMGFDERRMEGLAFVETSAHCFFSSFSAEVFVLRHDSDGI